jgi:hypothetical protein
MGSIPRYQAKQKRYRYFAADDPPIKRCTLPRRHSYEAIAQRLRELKCTDTVIQNHIANLDKIWKLRIKKRADKIAKAEEDLLKRHGKFRISWQKKMKPVIDEASV